MTFSTFCCFLVVIVAEMAHGATLVRGLAQATKSDLVLVDASAAAAGTAVANTQASQSLGPNEEVPIGEALDLFYRYGFFSLSVRVVPREDPGSWLVREPTVQVFDPASKQVSVVPGANAFDQQMQVFFCDDGSELLEAYFRDFTADGVEEPHKLYTGSWHTSTKARYLGLSKEVFDGESSFVMVRMQKKRLSVQTAGDLRLKPEAEAAAAAIRIGDRDSVKRFLRGFGSHFIKDVVVGDAVYQVFALTKEAYAAARGQLGPRAHMSHSDFASFYASSLSPWLVRETGRMLVASGDAAATAAAQSAESILRLREDSALLARLEQATAASAAVIGLHFATMSTFVNDIQNRDFFDEVVGAQSALWEANI